MPWKNGLGETLEVARSPGGRSLDDFDWRVSVAPVVSDGDFSRFPGIERTIAVIEGAGMVLDVAGQPVELRPGEPFTYDGGLAVHGRLVAGPVRDINVMVRRGRWAGEMILATGQVSIAAAGATVIAYTLFGNWTARVRDDSHALATGDSVLAEEAPLVLAPDSAEARVALAIIRLGGDLG